MMSVVIGKTFGNLVVVAKDLDNTESKTKWLCMCSCGNTVSVRDNSLKTGNTKSCGCIGKKKLIERSKTHGLSNSKLYQTWGNMKSRCDNEKNDFYMSYGGRGISYQPSWSTFENFLEDMGSNYVEGLSLERINLNGNYCKSNCCWIDIKDQAKNRGKPENNTSGFTGVDYHTNSCGTVYCRARWVENGKPRAKYFSTKKYDNAYDLACDFRQQKIRELNYGEYHGL